MTFKLIVFGTGMFYAIKWHYDKEKQQSGKPNEQRALLRARGNVAAALVLALLALALATLVLFSTSGLDLTFP
ncbi:hypothetical protein ABT364_01390 [Massilia sp. SR12]